MSEAEFKALVDVFRILAGWRDEAELQRMAEESHPEAVAQVQ